MKKLLLALLGLLIALPAIAFSYEHEGNMLEYTPNSDGTTCALTGGGANATGAVIIPVTVTDNGTDYTVTSIANKVFLDNQVIESVEMPNTITSVGSSCFSACSLLASVKLSTSLIEIAEYTFSYCSALTFIELPNDITTISQYAFYYSGLQSITLPASVKTVGAYAFTNAPVKNVVILSRDISVNLRSFSNSTSPNGAATNVFYPSTIRWTFSQYEEPCYYYAYDPDGTVFEDGILYNSDKTSVYCFSDLVQNVQLPNTVERIERNAAYTNERIKQVSLPNSVVEIGNYAFYASNLSSVELPEQIESIGDCAFDGCMGITNLAFEKVINIGNYAFRNCNNLTGLSLPSTLENIGNYAFYGCSGITSDLVVPESVTTLGSYAFYGCSGIASAKIPESITELQAYMFYNCSSLNSVDLPSTLTSIGSSAFVGCSTLEDITLPESLTAIGSSAFYNCNLLKSVTLPESLSSLGTSAFYGCSSLEAINIPEKVTTISSSAFYGCTALGSVELSEGVVTIGQSSFNGCTGLKTIDLPSSVTTIQASAFADSGLESLFLSDNITTVGNKAFSNCVGLKSVFVGNSVTLPTGSNNPFDGCSNIIKAAYPATKTNPFTTAFAVAYNPESSNYDNGVVYGEGLETILFVRPDLDGDYQAPASVNEIGAYAFYGCDRLENVFLSPTVSYIGTNAFQNSSVSTIALGEDCVYIGANAFDGTELTDIYITAQNPPAIKNNSFANYNATVHLQGKDTSNLYKKSKGGWANFKNYVLMAAPTGMSHSEERYILGEPGETFQLTAELEGTDLDFPTVYWYSTDPAVATVVQKGLVTIMGEVEQPEEGEDGGDGEGGEGGERSEPEPAPVKPTCNIVARSLYSGLSYVVKVNDSTFEVEGISLNFNKKTIELGGTLQLEVTFEPSDATDKTITWISSDETVATVDENGLVSTHELGSATITATSYNGEEDECEITVVSVPLVEVTGISLNVSSATLHEGETLQLEVFYEPDDATDLTVTWNSNNEEVATVDENGLVTAVANGDSVIMATTANGITAECEISVTISTGISGIVAGGNVSVENGTILVGGDGKARVYDLAGVLVATTDNGIVSHLSTGMYFVSIADGTTVKVYVEQ